MMSKGKCRVCGEEISFTVGNPVELGFHMVDRHNSGSIGQYDILEENSDSSSNSSLKLCGCPDPCEKDDVGSAEHNNSSDLSSSGRIRGGKGASADQRQPSADQRHPSVDQKHHFTDQRHPSTDQRHPSTDQKHPSTDQRHPSTDQRHHSTDQRHHSTDQRHHSTDERHPSTDQRHPSTDQRHPSTDQKHPSTDQRHPSTDQRQPPADQRQPPANQKHSSGDQRHLSVDQRHPSGDQRHPLAAQRDSFVDEKYSPAEERPNTTSQRRQKSSDDQRNGKRKYAYSAGLYKTTLETWTTAGGYVLCPSCNKNVRPLVRSQKNKVAYTSVGATFLLSCWPCCFLFPLMHKCSVDLYCPNCKFPLGTYDAGTGKTRPNVKVPNLDQMQSSP